LVHLGRLAESAEAYARVVELEPQDETARKEREEVMGKLQIVDSECHTPKRLCVR
jgi:predicted TPR repeat methyltransferase